MKQKNIYLYLRCTDLSLIFNDQECGIIQHVMHVKADDSSTFPLIFEGETIEYIILRSLCEEINSKNYNSRNHFLERVINDSKKLNKEILSEDYLDSLGYEKIKDDGTYAEYRNRGGVVNHSYGRMFKHKQIISFNRDGNYVGIKEDGGTRTVFSGKIASREAFEIILNSIM